jgi:hypothetical protein
LSPPKVSKRHIAAAAAAVPSRSLYENLTCCWPLHSTALQSTAQQRVLHAGFISKKKQRKSRIVKGSSSNTHTVPEGVKLQTVS